MSRGVFWMVVLLGWTSLAGAGEESRIQAVVLGAGCFWCVEAIYERIDGVVEAVSGYAGGEKANPTYEEVVAGGTGHAEVVRVVYDPSAVSLDQLLELFWKTHDPTNPDGVWPDFGPMYRSILLYESDTQKEAFIRSKNRAQAEFDKPIATEIVPLEAFYPAEDYHQDFVERNPAHPYVRRIAIPKLEKLDLSAP